MTDSEGGAIFLDQSQSAKNTNPGGGLKQSIDLEISLFLFEFDNWRRNKYFSDSNMHRFTIKTRITLDCDCVLLQIPI